MAAVTLTWVADDHREYDTKHGRKAAFKVKLEDGRLGEVTTNADTVQKRLTEFRGFVGKPTELVIEDGGKWDDGNPKPVKVKKPQDPSGGTNTGGQAAYRNTQEGQAYEQERMDRRTSLMQAIATPPSKFISWTQLADDYYKWLRASAANPPAPSASAETGVAPLPRPVSASTSAGSEQAGPVPTGAADARTTNAHEEGGASVESQPVGKRLPSAGECAHTSTSPLKLDGQALPKGYVRCVECNALSDKQGVIK